MIFFRSELSVAKMIYIMVKSAYIEVLKGYIVVLQAYIEALYLYNGPDGPYIVALSAYNATL